MLLDGLKEKMAFTDLLEFHRLIQMQKDIQVLHRFMCIL